MPARPHSLYQASAPLLPLPATEALDGGTSEGPEHSWFWKGLSALPTHQPEVVTTTWENTAGSAGTTGQEEVRHGS